MHRQEWPGGEAPPAAGVRKQLELMNSTQLAVWVPSSLISIYRHDQHALHLAVMAVARSGQRIGCLPNNPCEMDSIQFTAWNGQLAVCSAPMARTPRHSGGGVFTLIPRRWGFRRTHSRSCIFSSRRKPFFHFKVGEPYTSRLDRSALSRLQRFPPAHCCAQDSPAAGPTTATSFRSGREAESAAPAFIEPLSKCSVRPE